MKTAHDPRHLERTATLRELFTWEFNKSTTPSLDSTNKIIENLEAIDKEVEKSAPERPLNQINKIDLSILRLAIFELIIEKNSSPYRVVIDEAVELAKEFGGDSSPSFVNGALGNLISLHKIESKKI